MTTIGIIDLLVLFQTIKSIPEVVTFNQGF